MTERKIVGGPHTARVLSCLTLVAAITSGCATVTNPSGSPTGALAAAGTSSQVPAARSELLPLPRSVARRLPAGVFYLLAGPNPASYNLWEVSDTGAESQLTHNSRNFGISAFGASSAGIIMADSASGLDKLARLTLRGVRYLKDGTGSAPAINPRPCRFCARDRDGGGRERPRVRARQGGVCRQERQEPARRAQGRIPHCAQRRRRLQHHHPARRRW